MKRLIAAAVCLLLLCAGAPAARAQDAAYQRWLAEQAKQFRSFQDEQDKQFAKFLSGQWRRVEEQRDTAHFLGPQPRLAPVAPPATTTPAPVPAPVEVRIAKPALPPFGTDVPRPTPRSLPTAGEGVDPRLGPAGIAAGALGEGSSAAASAYRSVALSFFGAPVSLRYLPLSVNALQGDVTPKAIAAFWDEISKSAFDVPLAEAQRTRDQYALGDWAFAQLLGVMTAQLFPDDARRTLCTWFMLVKSGYRARVAYRGEAVYLLLPSVTTVYEVSFFTDPDGTRFYALSLDGAPTRIGTVFTYKGEYPGAARALDLRLREPPHFGGALLARALTFDFAGKTYQLHTQVEQTLADHLRRYPRLDMSAFFDAEMSSVQRDVLLPQLRDAIRGRSELEATELLLHFVQTAFEYKTAEDQFGFDKPFFADEIFVYPYSDCKGRAVLFAYLVRSLLGLQVIGLHFPNHLSTAVHFTTPVRGRTIRYDGVDYVVADATYINAVVGQGMPQFDGVAPEVVVIGGRR